MNRSYGTYLINRSSYPESGWIDTRRGILFPVARHAAERRCRLTAPIMAERWMQTLGNSYYRCRAGYDPVVGVDKKEPPMEPLGPFRWVQWLANDLPSDWR